MRLSTLQKQNMLTEFKKKSSFDNDTMFTINVINVMQILRNSNTLRKFYQQSPFSGGLFTKLIVNLAGKIKLIKTSIGYAQYLTKIQTCRF